MNIETACEKILGRNVAQAIIKDQGLYWAIVAAMARATTDQDKTAIETLREWSRDQREMESNYETPRV